MTAGVRRHVVDVSHFGVESAGTAGPDQTTKMQAAIDGVPAGTELRVPSSMVVPIDGTLAVPKSLTFSGDGIFCRDTTISATTADDDGTEGSRLVKRGAGALFRAPSPRAPERSFISLRDIGLFGTPGDASFGMVPSDPTDARVGTRLSWSNVVFAGFDIALNDLAFQSSGFQDLTFLNCDRAILSSTVRAFNANTFTNIQASECGEVVCLSDAANNVFVGGSFQGGVAAPAGFAVNLQEACVGNTFLSPYFENTVSVDDIFIGSNGCSRNTFIGAHHQSNGAVVTIEGSNNHYLWPESSPDVINDVNGGNVYMGRFNPEPNFLGGRPAAYMNTGVVHKFEIDGEWESSTGDGFITASPDGNRWRITVDNAGTVQVAAA